MSGLRFLLRDAHSLKDKRRIVRSLKDRLFQKFRVAVAEIDHQDVWQTAELGVAAVFTPGTPAREIVDTIDGLLGAGTAV